jgi:hypothetical protein
MFGQRKQKGTKANHENRETKIQSFPLPSVTDVGSPPTNIFLVLGPLTIFSRGTDFLISTYTN